MNECALDQRASVSDGHARCCCQAPDRGTASRRRRRPRLAPQAPATVELRSRRARVDRMRAICLDRGLAHGPGRLGAADVASAREPDHRIRYGSQLGLGRPAVGSLDVAQRTSAARCDAGHRDAHGRLHWFRGTGARSLVETLAHSLPNRDHGRHEGRVVGKAHLKTRIAAERRGSDRWIGPASLAATDRAHGTEDQLVTVAIVLMTNAVRGALGIAAGTPQRGGPPPGATDCSAPPRQSSVRGHVGGRLARAPDSGPAGPAPRGALCAPALRSALRTRRRRKQSKDDGRCVGLRGRGAGPSS